MNRLNKEINEGGTAVDEKNDEVLERLKSAVGPVIDSIEHEPDSERAILVIGAKEINAENGDYIGTQTFIDICGDYGILGEALYAELMSAIADKKPQFFQLLREVIKTIEEELELDDDNQPTTEVRVLH